MAVRKHGNQDLPAPSAGGACVSLPTLPAVKVALHQGTREQDIGKAALARRLDWHLRQVDRALNLEHLSRLDEMDAAPGANEMRLMAMANENAHAAS